MMKLSIVIEDNQQDATGKVGRAMMAELKTDEPGYEKIWAASWLSKEEPFGIEVEKMISDMKRLRSEEIKNHKVDEATKKIIN
jgi:hypothetical protein